MLSILIADDHEIVIRGLKDLLQGEFEEVYIGEALTGAILRQRLAERRWDLILMDIIMPNLDILGMIGKIRNDDPDVPILVLTAVSETEYAVRIMAAGANGYITKRHASDELILAVRKVLAGETYLSNETVRALAAGVKTRDDENRHEKLSQRELQVFRMIAEGKAVKEIAFDLSVSAKTVGTYIARIREKTGLENYVDIARYAMRHELVD